MICHALAAFLSVVAMRGYRLPQQGTTHHLPAVGVMTTSSYINSPSSHCSSSSRLRKPSWISSLLLVRNCDLISFSAQNNRGPQQGSCNNGWQHELLSAKNDKDITSTVQETITSSFSLFRHRRPCQVTTSNEEIDNNHLPDTLLRGPSMHSLQASLQLLKIAAANRHIGE